MDNTSLHRVIQNNRNFALWTFACTVKTTNPNASTFLMSYCTLYIQKQLIVQSISEEYLSNIFVVFHLQQRKKARRFQSM